MASMGELLKMMQGGTDRTGFADMADQYSFTPRKKEKSLEDILAGLEQDNTEMGGEESGDETGGFDFGGALDYIGEKGSNVKDFLEENFGDYVPESIANMSGGDIEKMEELSQLGLDTRTTFGKGFDQRLTTPKVSSTGVPKTGTVSMPVDDLKTSSFNPMSILKFLGKRSAPGAILIPTDLGAADFPIDEETGMPIYPDEFGMADGGRVGMQQGGMSMPALLGVSSGSSGNLFNNYMPNPSAVAGPNYGTTAAPNYNTYQAPRLTSLASPYSGAQFGNIGDYLGGPDPYAVTYNPYVDMGGSAYDNYGLGMTQEDIDKVFADTDKFSLAAQEAKRKAAEEAAAAAKKKQNTGGGGDGPGPAGAAAMGNNNSNNYGGVYGEGYTGHGLDSNIGDDGGIDV